MGKSYVLDDDDSSDDEDKVPDIVSPLKPIDAVIQKTHQDDDDDDKDDDEVDATKKTTKPSPKKTTTTTIKIESDSDDEPDWMKEYQAPKQEDLNEKKTDENNETPKKPKKTTMIKDDDVSSSSGWSDDDDNDTKPLAVRLSEKKQKEVLMIDEEREDEDMDVDAKKSSDARKSPAKDKENAAITNKRKIPAAFVGATVPKSKMPLLINHGALQKTANSTILFECKGSGEAVDLSGDVGAVGRLLVEREEQPAGKASTSRQPQASVKIDLKGVMYLARTHLLSSTVAIINVGAEDAKIETFFDEYIQLREDPSAENVACIGTVNDNYVPLEPGDEGFEQQEEEEKRRETKATKAAAGRGAKRKAPAKKKKKPAKKKPNKR